MQQRTVTSFVRAWKWISQMHLRPRQRPPWLLRVFWLWREEGFVYVCKRALLRLRPIRCYDPDWIQANETLTPRDVQEIKARILSFANRPLISVLLPVRSARADDLHQSVLSVLAQLYERWELCIVDDGSNDPEVRPLIGSFAAGDPRIKTALC